MVPGAPASRSPGTIVPAARPPGTTGSGKDSFTVYGGPASASHTVHQRAPVGAEPGRWSVVYRIHAPRGRAGSTARR